MEEIMRLALSIFFAVAMAMAAQLFQSDKAPLNASNGYPLQQNEQMRPPANNHQRRDDPEAAPEASSVPGWSWLWSAVNRVLPYVLVGWALGRLVVQFRNMILAFLGLLVLFNFFLAQTGIIQFTVSWNDFISISTAIQEMIISIGIVETISMLLGSWAGITGFLQVNKSKDVIYREDSQTA
jgi:uncharacterized membrane protein (Fun14 family)